MFQTSTHHCLWDILRCRWAISWLCLPACVPSPYYAAAQTCSFIYLGRLWAEDRNLPATLDKPHYAGCVHTWAMV